MTAIEVGRDACLLENTAKQGYQAAGVDDALSQITPAIQFSEHRPVRNAGNSDPVDIGLHWAKLLEDRGVERSTQMLSIAFRVRQIGGDA